MFLAEFDIGHLADHAWLTTQVFGLKVTLMSSSIAAMLLAGAVLIAFIVPLARRYQAVPSGGRSVVELLVIFVRDNIAAPALHEKADAFLPFLCTLFVFILSLNLLGMVPLLPMTNLLGLPIGGTATGILAVAGGLAFITFITILVLALRHQVLKCHEHHGWPMIVCVLVAPVVWFLSFAPPIKGVAGIMLVPLLTVLEFVGFFARCFALMIRLFANMLAGHTLLAVLASLGLGAIAGTLENRIAVGSAVGLVCFAGSVFVNILELLVAGIQAYVFTILTATFLSLYVSPAH